MLFKLREELRLLFRYKVHRLRPYKLGVTRKKRLEETIVHMKKNLDQYNILPNKYKLINRCGRQHKIIN